jgi:hypothetical protein
MCLLLVAEPGKTPKKEELEQASCANPHGFGFAFMTNDGIIRERGMSARKMIAKFLALREEYPDTYAMWHSRYATHGPKNEDNCHPYQVGKDELSFLAHNGILPTHLPASDKRSDTRVMAEEILPAMGGVSALDNEFLWEMLETWVGGSKVVIFTTNPNAINQIYILGEKRGHWLDGIWYSNYTYVVRPAYVAPKSYSDNRGPWEPTGEWSVELGKWVAYPKTGGTILPFHKSENGVWSSELLGETPAERIIRHEQEALEELMDDEFIILREGDYAECAWCRMTYDLNDVTVDLDICGACYSCFDCGSLETDCMCWKRSEGASTNRSTTSDDELAQELEEFLYR